MQTIQAKDWAANTTAWLWTEIGNGKLLRVLNVRTDWWIATKGRAWCCTPQTLLYVGTDEQAKQKQVELCAALVARRQVN